MPLKLLELFSTSTKVFLTLSFHALVKASVEACKFVSAISVLNQQLELVCMVPPQLASVITGHEGKVFVSMFATNKIKGNKKKGDKYFEKLHQISHTFSLSGSTFINIPNCHVSIDQLLNKSTPSVADQIGNTRAVLDGTKLSYGPNSQEALDASFTLAQSLIKGSTRANVAEAFMLLITLVLGAKRILGPDHAKTQEYQRWMELMRKGLGILFLKPGEENCLIHPRTDARLISDSAELNGKKANALQYTLDKKKIIIDLMKTEGGEPKRFKVFPSQLAFETGTSVIMPGGNLGMILSFDEEKNMYSVGLWGEFSSTQYRPDDLLVYFDSFSVSL